MIYEVHRILIIEGHVCIKCRCLHETHRSYDIQVVINAVSVCRSLLKHTKNDRFLYGTNGSKDLLVSEGLFCLNSVLIATRESVWQRIFIGENGHVYDPIIVFLFITKGT
jgi:hypothetical protein